MRRKAVSLLLAVLMIVISSYATTGIAASSKMKLVYIPDYQVSIAFPEDYITFERHDEEIDPRLAAEGVTLAGMKGLVNKNQGVCIYAFPPDFVGDINVVVVDSGGVFSMAELDYATMLTLSSTYKQQMQNVGVTNISVDTVSIGENTFLTAKMDRPADGMAILQYVTIADSQTVTITLTCPGSIPSESEEMMKQIAETSVLKKHAADSVVPSAGSDTGSNQNYYYDAELGIHFVIPDGWEQLNLSKERQTIKMKMGPIDGSTCNIMLAYQDIWSGLSDLEKASLGLKSRSDIESLANAEYLAAMVGLEKNQIVMHQYGGSNFGIGTVSQESPLGGNLNTLFAATFKNGYLVMFQMIDLTNNYRNSFDTVLESVYFD